MLSKYPCVSSFKPLNKLQYYNFSSSFSCIFISPSMLNVITTDLKEFCLEDEYALKCVFFTNILDFPSEDKPIEILMNSKTFEEIYNFMKKDRHLLNKTFNPMEICFSTTSLSYFDHLTAEQLLDVCNGANYLEYPYLLELCCKQLANRISQEPEQINNEVFGKGRVSNDDLKRIMSDFDWMDENL